MNVKKRMLSTLLAFLFIWQFVPCNVSASDNASTPSSETVKRVQQEVLSGNITNVDDVLDVALAQHLSIAGNSKIRSVDNDASLQIYQLLDSDTDAEGNKSETIAVTALLVLDAQGQSVSASEYTTHHMTGNNDLNEYSIFATHTTLLKSRTDDPIYHTEAVRVYSMQTVLTYGTAMTASKL